MKHLNSAMRTLKFKISRLYISILKVLAPKKALLIKREGERALLIQQLTRSIEVNAGYRKVRSRKGGSFAKNTQIVELQTKFLEAIRSCPIDEFETLSLKWIKKMKSI